MSKTLKYRILIATGFTIYFLLLLSPAIISNWNLLDMSSLIVLFTIFVFGEFLIIFGVLCMNWSE